MAVGAAALASVGSSSNKFKNLALAIWRSVAAGKGLAME